MNETQTYPRYTITVLVDNHPITVCDVQQVSENSEEVELYYPGVAVLPAAVAALNAAFNSVQFQVWKETGVMPVPRDYHRDDDAADAPF